MAKISLEENFGGKCWFLRDFGGKQATNGEDEHNEDNSTPELDDFIAAERSSNTKRKKRKRRNTSGKCLKGLRTADGCYSRQAKS